MAYYFYPKIKEYYHLQNVKKELQGEVEDSHSRIKELRRKREKFTSDRDFVKRMAHEMGFAAPDEVIFRFVDEQQSTNTAYED